MRDREQHQSGPCCGVAPAQHAPWVTGSIDTPTGPVPAVSTRLGVRDTLGRWRVRGGIGRNRHAVPPGLYAVGSPGPDDLVFVTANFKSSFDALRRELGGLDAWILVLDTKGINVWCAAGKGTFGTEELVERIEAVRLHDVVAHHTLVLPQLGAPGVAAHEVNARTGFRVVYGPVRAADLIRFLEAGMEADPRMRRVRFGLRERMAVAPVELVGAIRYLPHAVGILALVTLLTPLTMAGGLLALLIMLGTVLLGTLLFPALLPWLPFRAFSLKGGVLGLPWGAFVAWRSGADALGWLACLLLLPAFMAFLALNFTGATPLTSESGVNREIALYARPMAIAGVLGLASALVGLW